MNTKTTTSRAIALATAAMLALACCKQEGKPPGTEASSQAKPRVTSPAINELLAGVPGNAIAVGFIDVDDSPWSLITGGLLPLDEANRKVLDKELREYIDRYLGLDLSKLQYAVGYVSGPPPRGAVLLKTVGGALKMPGATDYEGAKLWIVDDHMNLAIKGDVVVFGKDDAVHEVLDTLAGKRKAVTVENKALVDWLRKESSGAVLACAAIAPKDMPLPPQIAGIERVAASIGVTGISAVVDGSDATITSLQTMADQGIAAMLGEAEKAHASALTGELPPPEGAMAIIGSAYAKSYAAKLKPRRTGNRLAVTLDLGLVGADAATVVAMIGIMAAVAIPAFMDYMKKSKAAQIQ